MGDAFFIHKGKNNKNEIIYGPSRGKGTGHFVSGGKKRIPFKFSAKNTGVASLKSENKCTLIALKVCSTKNRVDSHLNFFTELRLFC